jgi:hypothetical protein
VNAETPAGFYTREKAPMTAPLPSSFYCRLSEGRLEMVHESSKEMPGKKLYKAVLMRRRFKHEIKLTLFWDA